MMRVIFLACVRVVMGDRPCLFFTGAKDVRCEPQVCTYRAFTSRESTPTLVLESSSATTLLAPDQLRRVTVAIVAADGSGANTKARGYLEPLLTNDGAESTLFVNLSAVVVPGLVALYTERAEDETGSPAAAVACIELVAPEHVADTHRGMFVVEVSRRNRSEASVFVESGLLHKLSHYVHIATNPDTGWFPDRIVVRRLYGALVTACHAENTISDRSWMSHRQRSALFPCDTPEEFGGTVIYDQPVKPTTPGGGNKSRVSSCLFDGFRDLGRHRGISFAGKGSDSLWAPSTCAAVNLSEAKRRLAPLHFTVFGDSISVKFAGALRTFVKELTLLDLNDGVGAGEHRANIGVGLGWAFAENVAFADAPLDARRLNMHARNWPALRDAVKRSDVAILNSGLHDIAPYFACAGVAVGSGNDTALCEHESKKQGHPFWHGDKPAALAHFEVRLTALFSALAAAGLQRKVVWRTTTFPAIMHTREMLAAAQAGSHPISRSRWYERCDTQALRVDTVLELNTLAIAAARRHGIAVWDVSGLALDARRAHFADIVHPTEPYLETWVHMLAHHEVVVNASARANGRASDLVE